MLTTPYMLTRFRRFEKATYVTPDCSYKNHASITPALCVAFTPITRNFGIPKTFQMIMSVNIFSPEYFSFSKTIQNSTDIKLVDSFEEMALQNELENLRKSKVEEVRAAEEQMHQKVILFNVKYNI